MLSISYVGSNLVVDSFQCFGLKLSEKKWVKSIIYLLLHKDEQVV